MAELQIIFLNLLETDPLNYANNNINLLENFTALTNLESLSLKFLSDLVYVESLVMAFNDCFLVVSIIVFSSIFLMPIIRKVKDPAPQEALH